MAAHCLSSPLWQFASLMTSGVHWSLSLGYLSVSAGTSSFKHVDVLVPSVCHLIIQEMSFTPVFLCLHGGGGNFEDSNQEAVSLVSVPVSQLYCGLGSP